jgi:hypothetical protein
MPPFNPEDTAPEISVSSLSPFNQGRLGTKRQSGNKPLFWKSDPSKDGIRWIGMSGKQAAEWLPNGM